MRSRFIRTVVPLALAGFLLGGCASPSATMGSAAAADRGDNANVQKAGAPAAQTDAAGSLPESPVTDTQQIVRSATVNVVVPDPAGAATKLRSIATIHGGVVTSENVVNDAKSSYSTSTVVLSVPADQLDATLADIAGIGEVALRTIQSTDVTAKVADVDARVKTMRDSIARMQELLTRAGSVSEVAQVEKELTQRQSDLESLLAQQKALAQRVAQSPVSVTLSKQPVIVEPEPEPTGFLAGLSAGWRALKAFTVGVLTVVGAMLPFLVVIALIGAPIVWFARRRRAGAATTTSASPTTPQDS